MVPALLQCYRKLGRRIGVSFGGFIAIVFAPIRATSFALVRRVPIVFCHEMFANGCGDEYVFTQDYLFPSRELL